MTKVAEVFGELNARWTALIQARPNESFESESGVHPVAMTEAIRHLGAVIAGLEERNLFTSSPELAAAVPTLSARLASASALVNDANGNGLSWLGQQPRFFEDMLFVQATVGALTTKRISLTRDIAKDLEKKGLPELEKVIAAGEAATALLESKRRADESVAALGAAAASASAANEAVQSTAAIASTSIAEIKRLEGESKASAQAAIDAASKAEGTGRAINKLKEDAEAREAALEERVKEVRAQVTLLEEAAKASQQEITAAMRLARDQGLAESFQKRSKSLRTERMIWTFVFVVAVIVLVITAIVFVANLQNLVYEEFVIAFLKKLSIAAPCIWLGWYAARQIGQIAKVQEDYEYKAASALAYQSYKAEAAQDPDPTLRTSLLTHAIATFGENPVRLYADGSSDPVTPTESALKRVTKEQTELVAAIIGLIERAKKAGS